MIDLENIAKIYKLGDVQVAAVSGITCRVEAGEMVSIMGPSGSGKSTLMRIVAGILTRFDGRVSLCFGTHTHVVTADERILPEGTAYITDIGMTGAHDSVLGRKVENVLKSFRTQMPFPFEIATDDVKINGILVTVDSNTRRAERIERIKIDADSPETAGYDSDDGKPEYFNSNF